MWLRQPLFRLVSVLHSLHRRVSYQFEAVCGLYTDGSFLRLDRVISRGISETLSDTILGHPRTIVEFY